jgi:sirohydrochlorin ferrochelatase
LKTAVILLGHGSQAQCGNEALSEVARLVAEREGMEVAYAYLQFCSPTLPEAARKEVEGGADRVIIVPYFLYLGNHVGRDIPEELGRLKETYPDVEFVMTDHLGAHPKLAEIVIERIKGK